MEPTHVLEVPVADVPRSRSATVATAGTEELAPAQIIEIVPGYEPGHYQFL